MNIALTGAMRSGKDSVGAYLVNNYGYTRFAFGDGIRRVTRELYPQAYEGNGKPRALLQGFGQMARSFDPDVWVNDCFRRISEESAEYIASLGGFRKRRVVITDLRQPNEYARCREEGFVIIRVKSTSALRIARAVAAGDSFNPEDLTHETESHVDTFAVDYELTNDSTLDELYAQIDEVMRELGVKKSEVTR